MLVALLQPNSASIPFRLAASCTEKSRNIGTASVWVSPAAPQVERVVLEFPVTSSGVIWVCLGPRWLGLL